MCAVSPNRLHRCTHTTNSSDVIHTIFNHLFAITHRFSSSFHLDEAVTSDDPDDPDDACLHTSYSLESNAHRRVVRFDHVMTPRHPVLFAR